METIKATTTFTDKQLHRALEMSVSKEEPSDDGFVPVPVYTDPFVQREHVTGTDGHHAVNIPLPFFHSDPCFKASEKPNFEELFDKMEKFEKPAITITLDAINAILGQVPTTKYETCPECNGDGWVTYRYRCKMKDKTLTVQEPCPICDRRGVISAESTPAYFYPVWIDGYKITCDQLIWLRDVMKCLGMSSVAYHGGDAGCCYFRQDGIRFLIANLVSDESTKKLRRKYEIRSKREMVLVKSVEP